MTNPHQETFYSGIQTRKTKGCVLKFRTNDKNKAFQLQLHRKIFSLRNVPSEHNFFTKHEIINHLPTGLEKHLQSSLIQNYFILYGQQNSRLLTVPTSANYLAFLLLFFRPVHAREKALYLLTNTSAGCSHEMSFPGIRSCY